MNEPYEGREGFTKGHAWLREAQRRRIYDAYAAAAYDPVFMEDMSSTSTAYETTVGDGLKGSGG